jgi:hypothetical protein
MADKPILFSGPMVRALLAGTKTQTRRVIEETAKPMGPGQILIFTGAQFGGRAHRFLPRYRDGDRLYVRETFSGHHGYEVVQAPPRDWSPSDPVWYWADGNPQDGDWTKPKPGMHMPRWASRLTLTVTDVRVERVQDCSEADALAEGMTQATAEAILSGDEQQVYAATHILAPEARGRILYETIWDQINGDGAWESNPWVAAYTFTVEHGNIDKLASVE